MEKQDAEDVQRLLDDFLKERNEKPWLGITQNLASQDKLGAITNGLPRVLRIRLQNALARLETDLEQNPHIQENWKQLVNMLRNSKHEVEDCIGVRQLPDGKTVTVPMRIGRSDFKYDGVVGKVTEVLWALQAIENPDLSLYMSDVIYKEGQRISATGKKIAGDVDDKIIEALRNANYLNAQHGKKAGIKKGIADRHSVSQRHVDNLVRELKKNK